jgi:hypothetical protein
MFFTSFIKRDDAFTLIRRLFELPGWDDDVEEIK